MTGEAISLADLHAAPLIGYLTLSPGGADLIAPHARLQSWWNGMAGRPSIVSTAPDLSAFKRPKG